MSSPLAAVRLSIASDGNSSTVEPSVDTSNPFILLGVSGRDPFEVNAESQPPHRELAQAVYAQADAKGTPLSVRIARGRPKSLNARSKTVMANFSAVVASASQVSR